MSKTKIYAVADSVPEDCCYITAGKRYEVLREDGDGGFTFRADNGGQTYSAWIDSLHIGGSWRRIEVEEPDAAPEQPAASDGGPAFPSLSPRLDAAIRLRVPNSGDATVDAMIREANRRELAGRALSALLSEPRITDSFANFAKGAVASADALLAVLAKGGAQ